MITDKERIAALEEDVAKLTQVGAAQQRALETLKAWHEELRLTVESLGRIVVSMRSSADSSHGKGPGAN